MKPDTRGLGIDVEPEPEPVVEEPKEPEIKFDDTEVAKKYTIHEEIAKYVTPFLPLKWKLTDLLRQDWFCESSSGYRQYWKGICRQSCCYGIESIEYNQSLKASEQVSEENRWPAEDNSTGRFLFDWLSGLFCFWKVQLFVLPPLVVFIQRFLLYVMMCTQAWGRLGVCD